MTGMVKGHKVCGSVGQGACMVEYEPLGGVSWTMNPMCSSVWSIVIEL